MLFPSCRVRCPGLYRSSDAITIEIRNVSAYSFNLDKSRPAASHPELGAAILHITNIDLLLQKVHRRHLLSFADLGFDGNDESDAADDVDCIRFSGEVSTLRVVLKKQVYDQMIAAED